MVTMLICFTFLVMMEEDTKAECEVEEFKASPVISCVFAFFIGAMVSSSSLFKIAII